MNGFKRLSALTVSVRAIIFKVSFTSDFKNNIALTAESELEVYNLLNFCPKYCYKQLTVQTNRGVAYLNEFLQLNPDTFPEVFAQDIDIIQARVMTAVQKPSAIKNFADKVTQAAWKSKRSWYQVSANNRMISPELQRFIAKRIGATVISLPSSHVSMVSHPTEVANLIIEAAKAGASS